MCGETTAGTEEFDGCHDLESRAGEAERGGGSPGNQVASGVPSGCTIYVPVLEYDIDSMGTYLGTV